MTQPAERISTVPMMKIQTTLQFGRPKAESHKAHSVGQSRSRMPIGLSSRISLS